MGIFGWSYPAGCSGTPYDDPIYCEICGGSDDAKPGSGRECVCPECPVCGQYGEPDCYLPVDKEKDWQHGMVMTAEQKVRAEEIEQWLVSDEP